MQQNPYILCFISRRLFINTEVFLKTAIDNHGDMVLRVANAIVNNRHDAEEVFSDVFFALFKNKDNFKFSTEFLKPWLIRVSINKAKNLINSAFNRHRVQLTDNIESAATVDIDNKLDLEAALAKLDPDSRAIVYLHYFESYIYKDIASMLDLKEGTVRSLASRAKKVLKGML